MAAAMAAASSDVTTSRPNSAPASSTTTAGPVPCTAAKSFPKPPRRVPTAITLGTPVPGARMPRSSGQASSTTRTAVTAASGTRMSRWKPSAFSSRAHVEHQFVTVGAQLGHGRRV